MGWFAWSIELMTWAGLLFAFIVTYLKLNKVWIRRHDRNVADSISVTAVVLGLTFNTLPGFIKFAFVEPDFAQAGKEGVKLLAAAVFFAIGIGYWARQNERRGVWSLIRRAFRLERREAADLVRGFVRPVGARKIVGILDQVALIDRHYEESEHRFISEFARAWRLEYHDADLAALRTRVDSWQQDQLYVELRKSMVDYLHMHPPAKQVAHLVDVIRTLINIDEKPTEQEKFVLSEIEGITGHYLQDNDEAQVHHVVIAPQNVEQREAIAAILPQVKLVARSGGHAYEVGTYYSQAFADMMAGKYRAMNYFTVVDAGTADTWDRAAAGASDHTAV